MNSTLKGDLFEELVFNKFLDLIENDQYFIRKDCYEIYKKKPYYSKDRESDIIFDIAIESKIPQSNKTHLLILIECKDYKGSVPINDLEEFYQKSQQIKPAKQLLIFISTGKFQSSCLTFARSKGISLARFIKDDPIDWILERNLISEVRSSSPEWLHAHKLITQDKPRLIYTNFVGLSSFLYSCDFRTFVCSIISDNKSPLSRPLKNFKNKKLVTPYRSLDEIDSIAELTRKNIKNQYQRIDLIALCNKLNISILFNEKLNCEETLGLTTFDPPLIKIRDHFNDSEQQRFTIAHEIAHHILNHSNVIKKDSLISSDLQQKISHIEIPEIQRIEYQANLFAAALLAPRAGLIYDINTFCQRYNIQNRGFGTIFLDDQHLNINNYKILSHNLCKKYGISHAALKIRLIQLKILIDQSKEQLTLDMLLKGVDWIPPFKS